MWRNKVLPLTYVQSFSCLSLLRREPSPPRIPQVDSGRARRRRQLKPACVMSGVILFNVESQLESLRWMELTGSGRLQKGHFVPGIMSRHVRGFG